MKKVVDKNKIELYCNEIIWELSKEYHFINLGETNNWNFRVCHNLTIINTPKLINKYLSCYYSLLKIKILNYRKLSITNQDNCNLKFFGKIKLSNIKFWLHNNKLKNINFEPILNKEAIFVRNHNIIITKQKINI